MEAEILRPCIGNIIGLSQSTSCRAGVLSANWRAGSPDTREMHVPPKVFKATQEGDDDLFIIVQRLELNS
jgi:hypothetical protein